MKGPFSHLRHALAPFLVSVAGSSLARAVIDLLATASELATLT